MTSEDNWRIDHTGIGVSDIAKAAKFYDAALGALGLEPIGAHHQNLCRGAQRQRSGTWRGRLMALATPIFWIDVFHPHGTKQHVAFRARSRGEVEDFHRAAISSGGQDNGGPGLRSGDFPPGYFAAFVLDPDGNKHRSRLPGELMELLALN